MGQAKAETLCHAILIVAAVRVTWAMTSACMGPLIRLGLGDRLRLWLYSGFTAGDLYSLGSWLFGGLAGTSAYRDSMVGMAL